MTQRLKKTLLACTAVWAIAAQPATAAPYCSALRDAAQLDKKYKRLAPIWSDTNTGWIFTSDQMDATYTMTSEATRLMSKIVNAFDEAGVDLAMIVAPPRPLVAGQAIVDEAMGAAGAFDTATTKESFHALIEQLRATGAVVPDLLTLATQNTQIPFYFQRDTHWTNSGAAASALALAAAYQIDPKFDVNDIIADEIYAEKGSLSQIVTAACDIANPPEETATFDYGLVAASQGLGLLDETGTETAALLGTSFSDRNKRDQYQFADALSAALGKDVHNLSVSGGGLIGPIEAYVLSGALNEKQHPTVIWEFPYTQSLNVTSELRQLLGALRADHAKTGEAFAMQLSDNNSASVDVPVRFGQSDLIHVTTENRDALKLSVKLTFEDGNTKELRLRRKNRIPEDRRSADWWLDLSGLETPGITEVSLKFDKDEQLGRVMMTLFPAETGS